MVSIGGRQTVQQNNSDSGISEQQVVPVTLALTPEEKMTVEDPVAMERLAAALPLERTAKRWIVSDDADEHVEKIGAYVGLGFNHLVFHAPGPDQARFLRLYSAHILPRLRKLHG